MLVFHYKFTFDMLNQRIVFSTNTPNDQGFIIPNEVINFNRYKKNPVILKQHNWNEPPIGLMTDVRFENGEWTGIPVFHRLTNDSREYGDMWDAGFLTACSIGGYKELETTGRMLKDKDGKQYPEPKLNKEGLATATIFDLYEISMVTIPSNEDAVAAALAAVSYDTIDLSDIEKTITSLSSKFNMETEAEKALRLAKEAEDQNKAALDAAANADKTKTTLTAGTDVELPPVIKEAISKEKSGFGAHIADMFKTAVSALMGSSMKEDKPDVDNKGLGAAPTPKNTPDVKPGADAIDVKLPGVPSSLQTLRDKVTKAQLEADDDIEEMKAAKECADKMGASEDDKSKYEAAKLKAEEAVKKVERLSVKLKAAEDECDDEGEMKANGENVKTAAKQATGLSATGGKEKAKIITMKTPEQLRAELKLANAPSHAVKVGALSQGKTLSQLKSDKGEGERIYQRFKTSDAGSKSIEDYAVVLNCMMNESRFAAVMERTRFMQNVNEAQLGTYRSKPQARTGLSLKDLAAKLNSGYVDIMTRQNTMKEITTLTATDNFLASPDLLAIEFLDLAIFKLFPNTSWKNEIPLFAATETGNNTGLIWANITAQPGVTRGAQPVNPTNYTYTDDAVSLNLTPYWLQPMVWTPLTMHQLRYDQMSTGWAQAFAYWGAVMDDDLIYTLASTVPQSSIVYSSGLAGQIPATPLTFVIASSNDPNEFYYNPAFRGTLNQPTLNDVISVEQIYNKQNFELAGEIPYLVIDPTTDALISKNPQTQNLLTRWVNADGAELQKFKFTVLNQRSRVAIFDPTTGQVKDPRGVIPSTATGANLGFIPSQVGMGLGMLDVFMIQDPSLYGYKMSADIRIGIVPLRKDFSGTSLLVYGPSNPAVVS
jgi:hypothetical protein